MLSLLDKYQYDNLKQHTHYMSSDNEYVTLLKYAIHLNIDLSTFPTLWAVLSILLDTQYGNLEYVKLLQEEETQNHMHDSVTQDFDRISDLNDSGSTPTETTR